MVSSPCRPRSVSTFEMVPLLAKLPSVSVSLPEPRSILPFDSWLEIVMVSVPLPPRMLSTLAMEPELAMFASGENIVARAEIDQRTAGQGRTERDVVARRAADNAFRRSQWSAMLAKLPSTSLSSPALRSMLALPSRRVVIVSVSSSAPPIMRFDVCNGRRVAEGAEDDGVFAGSQVDRGVRGRTT